MTISFRPGSNGVRVSQTVLLWSRSHDSSRLVQNVSVNGDTDINDDTKPSLTCIRHGGCVNSYRTQNKVNVTGEERTETMVHARNRSCRCRQSRGLGVYIATGRHCPCRGRAETGAPGRAGPPAARRVYVTPRRPSAVPRALAGALASLGRRTPRSARPSRNPHTHAHSSAPHTPHKFPNFTTYDLHE